MPMKPNTKLIIISLSVLFLLIYSFLIAISHPALLGWALESSFRLAPDSRLPKWFSILSGYDRKDLTVQIYCYSPPPPFQTYNMKAELLGPPPEYHVLDKRVGKSHWHPDSERRGHQSYPIYVIASVNGIEEVVEHKLMEPIFYISDDPRLIQEMKQLKK